MHTMEFSFSEDVKWTKKNTIAVDHVVEFKKY